jgi:hypothetical protein
MINKNHYYFLIYFIYFIYSKVLIINQLILKYLFGINVLLDLLF